MSRPGTSACPTQQTLTDRTKIHNEALQQLASLNLEEGDPTAIYPKQAPGVSGKKFPVVTNAYQVKMPNVKIYRYDVTFTGIVGRNKEIELSKKSSSSVVIADRINVCRQAFRLVFKLNPEYFGTDSNRVFYDLQSTIYTMEKLVVNRNGENIFDISLDDYRERGNPVDHALRHLKAVKALIKETKSNEINMSDLKSLHDPESGVRNRSLLTILEMIVNQYPMFHENQFLTLRGSVSYYMDGDQFNAPEIDIDGGGRLDNCTKYLAAGIKKSGALIQGDASHSEDGQCIAMLLESKRSPFHTPGINLITLIERHASLNQHASYFREGDCDVRSLQYITRTLRRILFHAVGQNKNFEVSNVVRVTANQQLIPTERDGEMTVTEYYLRVKHIELQYPNAHMVSVKVPSGHIFYPAEMIIVSDNQTVLVEQMDSRDKAKMIKNAAIRPDHIQRETANGAGAIRITNSEYVKAAGIQIDRRPLTVEARKLPNPGFKFANNTTVTIPGKEASWRMHPFLVAAQNKKFDFYLIGTESDKNPAINSNDLEMFFRTLCTAAKSFGMTLGVINNSGWIFDHQVEGVIEKAAKDEVPLVYFVSPTNIKLSHDTMKHCEHRYKTVVTQDIRDTTVRKVIQRGSSTLENIISKTNIKLGGVNYSLRVEHKAVLTELQYTLFIGISTNQPGAKSRADKAQGTRHGKDEKPGVFGYCGNICKDRDTFAGDFIYMNAYRTEAYNALDEAAYKCVSSFITNRKNPPRKVVFYYAGVSEGQYENVMTISVPRIKNGIRKANNGVDIPLTLISVQKINNVNLFPTEYPVNGEHDWEYNVPPGTVVDKALTHPLYADFYLTAHSALKGHAHTPRYTVLVNEAELSMDILQNLTFALCYEHQIVGKATALPTPIYVAEAYAMRGRHVFVAASLEANAKGYSLPRDPSGALDLERLTLDLNYHSCPLLRSRRVNA